MDNENSRHMEHSGETVYGNDDNNVVMSEKVEKSYNFCITILYYNSDHHRASILFMKYTKLIDIFGVIAIFFVIIYNTIHCRRNVCSLIILK